MRRVRIEHDGSPAWGELRDGEIARLAEYFDTAPLV